MKVLTLTIEASQLEPMLDLLRRLYYDGRFDGMSIYRTEAEWALESNPFIGRNFREFSTVLPAGQPVAEEALWPAARRALLEERPDVVLIPPCDQQLWRSVSEFCRQTATRMVRWQPQLGVEDFLKPGPEATPVIHEFNPAELLEPHLPELLERAGEACFFGPQELLRRLGLPQNPDKELAVSLFTLGSSEAPEKTLGELKRFKRSLVVEAVNLSLSGGRRRFHYKGYDNEFALCRPDLDLATLLGPQWSAEVLGKRANGAGAGGPEAPNQPPLFLCGRGFEEVDWLQKFRIPEGERLNIVLADSQNIAGSVLNHAATINRYTPHQAWALCTTRHPFIDYPAQDCRVFYLEESTPSPEVREILEKADCFIFFEDDDENSSSWPFSLAPYMRGKAALHLYIGWRVHKMTPELERQGRTLLTPLPHLLRMYPQASFYAGFPPATLEDVRLRPALSETDGIVRVLQTPSLPHRTLGRYYYHKDTETYLRAARELKARHGAKVEFWQVAGWPHQQILEARQQADITFNQLRGYHGLSGDEAMVLERPMVQAFDQFNWNRHREYWGLDVEFPWRTSTRESLVEDLDELISSQELRRQLGKAGRQFMREYFSPQVGIVPLIYYCYQAIQAREEKM